MHRHVAHHVSGRSTPVVHPRRHDHDATHDVNLPNGKAAITRSAGAATATMRQQPAGNGRSAPNAAVAEDAASLYRIVRICAFERGASGAPLTRE